MDTNPHYAVLLTVRVDDPEALFNAAMTKNLDVDPQTSREDFQHDDGSVNVEACLQCVYDPGESMPGTELKDIDCEEE